MNIVVQDLLTHYEVQGQGRSVLLLHGWGDNLQGLAVLRKQLAQNFQVISVDLPGFGTTQAPAEVWDLDNYASFTKAFLAKVQASPYAIVGHSNGGALAIRGLATEMLDSEKLVLIAASGIRNKQSAKRLVLKFVAKFGNAATIVLPSGTRAKLRRRLYGAVGSDLLVVEGLQETFKKTVRQDVQSDAASLKLPTLLIFAADDQAVTLADGKTYNRLIANSRLEVIENAGHFVHLDQPETVNNLLQDFLK